MEPPLEVGKKVYINGTQEMQAMQASKAVARFFKFKIFFKVFDTVVMDYWGLKLVLRKVSSFTWKNYLGNSF